MLLLMMEPGWVVQFDWVSASRAQRMEACRVLQQCAESDCPGALKVAFCGASKDGRKATLLITN